MRETTELSNELWIAFDKKTGLCLTEKAIALDDAAALMRDRTGSTALRTIATHRPGENADPSSLSWL